MAKDVLKLRRRILGRMAIVVAVVTPISYLYDMSLVYLSPRQLEIQNQAIMVLLPLSVVLIYFLFKALNQPVMRVLDLLEDGVDVGADDIHRAERRALTLPYLVGVMAAVLFFLVSLITNLNIFYRSSLAFDMLVYLEASSATTSLMLGLGSVYMTRPVIRDVSLKLAEHHPAEKITPAFFIPISVKVTGAFFTIVAIVLVFAGLLSSSVLRKMLVQERLALQERELETVIDLFPAQDDLEWGIPAGLGTTDKTFVLLNNDNQPVSTAGKAPPAEILAALTQTEAGRVMTSPDQGAWLKMAFPDGRGFLLSGWPPLSTGGLAAKLAGYFGIAALVALAVAGVVAFLVARDISVTLKELSSTAARIAEGSQEARIVAGGDDETGVLARAFNRMSGVLLRKLREELEKSRAMIETIDETVKVLSPMSRELASFTEQQAASSREQVDTAQSSAASCQEVATIAGRISETSADVVNAVEVVLKVAAAGQDQVSGTRHSFDGIQGRVDNIDEVIKRLKEHSRAIMGILAIIEEVSDQINLLALNASLEAAGAGEYGSRFGVVAEEVGRLASRTEESTDQVRKIIDRMEGLINESISRSGEGVQAVQAGRNAMEEMTVSLGEILQASTSAVNMAKEIDQITRQQTTASDNMAAAMEEVRKTAQQASAAAARLLSGGNQMRELISRLEIHEDDSEEMA